MSGGSYEVCIPGVCTASSHTVASWVVAAVRRAGREPGCGCEVEIHDSGLARVREDVTCEVIDQLVLPANRIDDDLATFPRLTYPAGGPTTE